MSVAMLRKKTYFIQFSFKNRALNNRGGFFWFKWYNATTRKPMAFISLSDFEELSCWIGCQNLQHCQLNQRKVKAAALWVNDTLQSFEDFKKKQ